MSHLLTTIELQKRGTPVSAQNAIHSHISRAVEAIGTSRKHSSIIQQALPPVKSAASETGAENAALGPTAVSQSRVIIIIAILSASNFLSSITTGHLTVGLPRIATDLALSESLQLWPQSVYGLTSGCSLLLIGSIADVVGSRYIFLSGCFLLSCFILGCGLVRNGEELIAVRALQGLALSMTLPTSVSILTKAAPSGRTRNVGFSCLGLSQSLGYSLGLVLGGLFLDTIGWRTGYILYGAFTFAFFLVGIWAVPSDHLTSPVTFKRLVTEIDWIGAILASSGLAIFAYVLAMLTANISNIRQSSNIVPLVISLAIVPAFIFWMRRQERCEGNPVLIPNSIWKNMAFTSICIMLLLSYAVMQTMELFCSLFFQQVQHLSALQASIRLTPSLILSVGFQLFLGQVVHRFSANYLIIIGSVLTTVSPLLMALANPVQPYWYSAFFAQLLEPFSSDLLFTVGLLIVSNSFPARTQSLAGAVFNTVAQFGTSIGLAVMAVISSTITQGSKYRDKASDEALLLGYRAAFWAAFAWMITTVLVGIFGLRKVGRVGLKDE